MSKPTWKPTLPQNRFGTPLQGWRFCDCCVWRLVECGRRAGGGAFCATCLARAAELGGPTPPPPPPRLTWAAYLRSGDPSGLLAIVDANNAEVTAVYLAELRAAVAT